MPESGTASSASVVQRSAACSPPADRFVSRSSAQGKTSDLENGGQVSQASRQATLAELEGGSKRDARVVPGESRFMSGSVRDGDVAGKSISTTGDTDAGGSGVGARRMLLRGSEEVGAGEMAVDGAAAGQGGFGCDFFFLCVCVFGVCINITLILKY